jgi:hypothetical protein
MCGASPIGRISPRSIAMPTKNMPTMASGAAAKNGRPAMWMRDVDEEGAEHEQLAVSEVDDRRRRNCAVMPSATRA